MCPVLSIGPGPARLRFGKGFFVSVLCTQVSHTVLRPEEESGVWNLGLCFCLTNAKRPCMSVPLGLA